MIDFKGSIWLSAEDVGSGYDLVLDNRNCECEEGILATQQYIRADLVPHWQPIETLTTNERVIVLFDNDHIDSGWLDNIDERRFFRTGHGKLPLTRLTHWMPIPKVPE